MKKFMVIFVLTFLAVIGLNKYEKVAWAENSVEVDIDLHKYVFSDSESYLFDISIFGENFNKAKNVTLTMPSGKRVQLKNSAVFDDIQLYASCESYDDFKEKFPEGEYSIILSPKKYGSHKVDITHDFPETPEITYPEDGAVDVSLAPTITWEALNNIDSLTISIQTVEDGNEIDKIYLSKDATSYTIPSGLLQPNTKYELSLKAETVMGGGEEGNDYNELETIRVIGFTTGSE